MQIDPIFTQPPRTPKLVWLWLLLPLYIIYNIFCMPHNHDPRTDKQIVADQVYQEAQRNLQDAQEQVERLKHQ